jgi:hypothetical protein
MWSHYLNLAFVNDNSNFYIEIYNEISERKKGSLTIVRRHNQNYHRASGNEKQDLFS